MEGLAEQMAALHLLDEDGSDKRVHEAVLIIKKSVQTMALFDWREKTQREKDMILGKLQSFWNAALKYTETKDVSFLELAAEIIKDIVLYC